ncbi:hypothetical protein EHS25_006564 [Saitozyma podzolica]|uniref:Flavodoxin-like domain-containing protein n=1 Tax=Saitozyma podzolica TaxID=1890683 RepID=A0A427YS70_9TREE|nr:hypothetical protein EHS25_006564 [Saitozyma podzolica]
MYGHVATLAESVIKGVEASGAIVKPYQIQETLSEEVLTKMHGGASLKPKYPLLTPDDLKEVDGVLFGCPTRYGRVAAQLSAFFDHTGGLWFTGGLVGKFVGMFTSAAGPHGGHESTALTSMPFFAHQGMVFVPLGYTHPYVSELNTVHGGAPWGASTVAASDGSRQPLPEELELAEFQGKSFATFVSTFVRGKHLATGEVAGTTPVAAAAAKEVPQQVDSQKDGYSVPPATATDTAGTAATTTTDKAPAPAGDTTGTTAADSAPPPTSAAGAPTTSPATGAAAAQQPKKRGFFARCCGGGNID